MLVCCWSPAAHAGAWLMSEGKGLAITQFTHFSSDSYWDTAGDSQPQARYTKWEIQPYAEYGLTSKVTVGGTAYLQRAEQSNDINKGIADPEFFARMRLWQHGSHLVSIQPIIKLPSYFEHNESNPRGGSKSTDAELSLLYGTNLNLLSDHDYADVRIGYRYRSRGLEAQYKADAALGISPWENWQLIPALRYVKAADISSGAAFSQNGDLDYDLLKAELTVMHTLPSGNWIHATYFDHVSGMQTGDGKGVSLGYAVRF